uniref:Uncharacterized protein n=2 Tax=Aegilops tauschii subsp. strangulata TaxID=200361 RepID=A0A453SB24_AEGTS
APDEAWRLPREGAALLRRAAAGVHGRSSFSSMAACCMDTDTWSWRRRSQTMPLRWLPCFPPGTRSSGCVFLSYAYYLSRYLHAARGVFAVLQRRRGVAARVFAHTPSVAMAFLWLEFSWSFQVLAILASTPAHAVDFGFQFWVDSVGLPLAPPDLDGRR